MFAFTVVVFICVIATNCSLKVAPNFLRQSRLQCSPNDSPKTQCYRIMEPLFEKLNGCLGLKMTDFSDKYNMKSWNTKKLSEEDSFGEANWFDESKGSKLT